MIGNPCSYIYLNDPYSGKAGYNGGEANGGEAKEEDKSEGKKDL